MWYPSRARTNELRAELVELEDISAYQAENLDEYLPAISTALRGMSEIEGFPRYQIRDWIWVASQFRLHASEDPEIVRLAGSALNFVGKLTNAEESLTEDAIRDLNWILDSTIAEISANLGPSSTRTFLSHQEIEKIEGQLSELMLAGDVNLDELRAEVEPHLQKFKAISSRAYLPSLLQKVESLFRAAASADIKAKVAIAALRYLAKFDDVVHDSLDYLGLLDDIHVIERAYADLAGHTLWLPVLERFLEEWPLLDDIVLDTGVKRIKPGLYLSFVMGACLEGLFGREDNTVIVVPEPGPSALLVALLASVTGVRRQEEPEDEIWPGEFEVGAPVFLGDADNVLKAEYGGYLEIEGQLRHWLKVRNKGRIAISDENARHLRSAQTTHSILSLGPEITKWLANHPPHPLTYFIGPNTEFGTAEPQVLLLTQRKKLDAFLPLVRPMGYGIAELVGLRYVTATGRLHDFPGSTTDRPLVWCCSDAEVAKDLIVNPSGGLNPKFVIVDGAKPGYDLHAALESLGKGHFCKVLVIAPLHEKEPCLDLIQRGFATWMIRDSDVEVPAEELATIDRSSDSLTRYIRRQRNHLSFSTNVHEIKNDFFEGLNATLRKLRKKIEDFESTELDVTAIVLSSFLIKAVRRPLDPGDLERAELGSLFTNLIYRCSSLKNYDPDIADLYGNLEQFNPANLPTTGKEAKVRELLSEYDKNFVGVLCGSKAAAVECQARARADPQLGGADWISMEALRRDAPYDKLIVPCWYDKMTMRELRNCGFANHQDLVFLPFERAWANKSSSSAVRWERSLEARNRKVLKSIEERYPGVANVSLWTNLEALKSSPKPEDIPVEMAEDEEIEDTEYLESRIIEIIRATVPAGEAKDVVVPARLVVFEESGAHAFLPPKGRVICLSGVLEEAIGGEEVDDEPQGVDAEKMLYMRVEDITPGCLLAFSKTTDRDLVDAKADQFIENSQEIRRLASLWRTALSHYVEEENLTVSSLCARLANVDVKRDPQTIRYWLNPAQSSTVAPRNWRKEIPAIAELTGFEELNESLVSVLSAVDLVYRGRRQAAEALVRELINGELDVDRGEIALRVDDTELVYELHRVRSIDPPVPVPYDLIGVVRKLGDDLPVGQEDASS